MRTKLFSRLLALWMLVLSAFVLPTAQGQAVKIPRLPSDIFGLQQSVYSLAPGYTPIATRSFTPDGSPVTSNNRNYRIRHKAVVACSHLRLLYCNYNLTTSGETDGANNIVVKAAIEYPYGTTASPGSRYPVYFQGRRSVTIEPGGWALSDPVPVVISSPAYFGERVQFSTSGGSQPFGQNISGGGSQGQAGEATDSTSTDFTDGGTSYNFGGSYAQGAWSNAIYGIPATPTSSVYFVTDSIGFGLSDLLDLPNIGIFQRAVNEQIPYTQQARSGMHLADLANPTTSKFMRLLMAGNRHVVSNLVTNDIAGTLASLKANVLSVAATANLFGAKYWHCTMLPVTTSTNAWRTASAQTVSANEANRLAFNAWLRDTSASGFVAQAGGSSKAGYFDNAALVEVNSANVLTLNGGFWKVPVSDLVSGTATAGASGSLTDSSKSWTTNAYRGMWVYITGGTGAGQLKQVYSNTSTVLSLTPSYTFSPVIDATSTYVICDLFTGDGTHPSATGYATAAQGININLLKQFVFLPFGVVLFRRKKQTFRLRA